MCSLVINFIYYFVVLRFLAMIVMLFFLIVLGDLFVLVGGVVIAKVMLDVFVGIFF